MWAFLWRTYADHGNDVIHDNNSYCTKIVKSLLIPTTIAVTTGNVIENTTAVTMTTPTIIITTMTAIIL